MSKINEGNNNKINYFKKINHKIGQKENLYQKYFYKLNLSPKKVNIFQLMENGLANQDELEQVDNICIKAYNNKKELEQKKIECLKSMILHHKQIPEKWIIQSNYKDMLSKAMADPIVLSYAIESKEIYKKRSTSVSIDDSEIKNLQKNITEPKFISYINPYSRNYANSLRKHKLMREYCYNIKNKKNRNQENKKKLKINFTENNDIEIKKEEKKIYLNTEGNKDMILPYIFPNIKEMKRKINKNKKNKEDDKEDTFMVTSLYYDENKLNKENKDNNKKSNKNNDKTNDDEINSESNNKSIEKKSDDLPKLPMIE